MNDRIFESFLESQYAQGVALARSSDILELVPVDGTPPRRYIAGFRARGLALNPAGEVVEFDRFDVGIWLPDDYLRRAEAPQVLTYLGPSPRPFHPNIRPPFICVHLRPGTPLVDLLYSCFELWTYNLYATHDEGLNHAAAQWARNQPPGRFPVDGRSLKRRPLSLQIVQIDQPAPAAERGSAPRARRR
jgi:hypothetical protein